MARRSLFTQVLVAFLSVILLALIAATWAASTAMRRFYMDQTAAALGTYARIAERQLSGQFSEASAVAVDASCKEIGKLSGTRITVILPSGKVIGDSFEDPAGMDNHADRPEVREALAGRAGRAVRYSHTLRSDLVYAAVPVLDGGRLTGIVRASTSLAAVHDALRRVYMRIAAASSAVALLSVLVGLSLVRRIVRPLRLMVAGTQRFAAGNLESRLPLARSTELADLASAMNSMASQLRHRIQTAYRQRSELDAVLSSMVEGVLAVDKAERVISLNPAAAALFGVAVETARGRDIREVVRNPKIQACVGRLLSQSESFGDDAVLAGPDERYLHISATNLCDEEGHEIGGLLVFQDVTEVRRLERVRSDFVANVSHEIRTPVTSIKGYAETLLNEGGKTSDTLERFLAIIVRQADRLSSLVDDILSLASLERAEAAGGVVYEPVGLRAAIEAATHVCAPKAASKNLHLVVICDPGLTVRANAPLLEEALVNLLDNAIKYSNAAGEVQLVAAPSALGAAISIRDSGAGIASEHLPRIFERFYRIDRARGRSLGGTGLGLAIVKHIVNLHGGQISVESTLGKGSCFTIDLPAA